MPPGITEEIIAGQSPQAQAIIRGLLAENAELKARIEALERQAKGKTPQNSSLPPSSQHPHARPQPGNQSKKKRGGQPGHEKHERPLIPPTSATPCKRSNPANAGVAARSSAGATPSRCGIRSGNCRDQGPRYRIPTPSVDVSLLRRNDVCGIARRRTAGPIRAAIDGVNRMLMAFYRQSKRRTAEFLGHVVGSAVLPGADGENPKPGDGGFAAVVRRVGGSIAGTRAFEHRQTATIGRKRQGGAFAAARNAKQQQRCAQHVSGIVRASPVVVDVLASRRGRTDKQRGRAVVASCGDMAEAVVWDAERQRQSLRRDDADGDRNLPPTTSQRLLLHHGRRRSSSRSSIRPFIVSGV